MIYWLTDDARFILSHTPRQILQEKGRRFVISASHHYDHRRGDPIKFPRFDYRTYLDKLPDDSFFSGIVNDDLTLEEVKLSFISRCAMRYSDRLEFDRLYK